ncbi:MAG: type VI secretion system baseplate subunit TssF, partial [Sedimentisphaerales bacterium]|nr:type VI secretion system baseplate subunit TssF [Sedimentisphaerales bacterium]
MDKRMLRYYDRELAHLRTMGGEFAREFPKIAGRLALDEFACADPYVERLLEGFAFLAARVQFKLDAEFPRFTQSILETVYPHLLSPVPSMAIVQFNPDFSDSGLADGYKIPRDTSLLSILGKGEQTRCEYRTAHDVTLRPIRLVEARYYTRELGVLDLPARCQAQAGIRIRLEVTAGLTFGELQLDALTFYLKGGGALPMRLYEQLFAHGNTVVVQSTNKPIKHQKVINGSNIRQVGFKDNQKLLHYDSRSFQGYRLLQEYFTFPQRFMFFELTGLSDTIRGCSQTQLDVIILLDEPDVELENAVDASNFALYCTPTINLFPKRTDRIHVKESFSEFHVIPDRTRPLDFEVYRIDKVTGFGANLEEQQVFLPFYSASDVDQDQDSAYYTCHRVPRLLSEKEKRKGRRSQGYGGSEVFIS